MSSIPKPTYPGGSAHQSPSRPSGICNWAALSGKCCTQSHCSGVSLLSKPNIVVQFRMTAEQFSGLISTTLTAPPWYSSSQTYRRHGSEREWFHYPVDTTFLVDTIVIMLERPEGQTRLLTCATTLSWFAAMPKTLLCEMSTQTVKTRLMTLLQTASILHALLTIPACYFRRKVPGKMLHLDMPFHWKHLLTTKRTFQTLTTCSWGHLSTPLYPRWGAAYHRGINCCSRGHLSIPLYLQWGSVYHRNNSWCCSHPCMSERTHLALARYFQGLQFSSWASSSGITRFNGWSLCCSIWAVDDTVSDPILTILSTSRVWTARVTTRCQVSTVKVDPLLP